MADSKKLDRKQECVQVVVRCRPFSSKETKENRGNVIAVETALFQISLSNPFRTDQAPKNFTFDAVYDETTQQKTFYEESCYDLVEGVMEGYNGTIFAYGQTGCGKTHTMQGYNDPPELRGVIPHSFDHIFENIKGSVNTAFLVRCCYLEIYNEEVRDLLAPNVEKKEKLELKEDPNKGVYIKDLTQAIVGNQESINRLMDQGQCMRTVGATAMNETSSRSHSIFTIVVEINDVDENGKDHIRVGKLNLVDLAGSERASKTGATGDRLKEGCKINLSLSALGNVISALVDGKGKHIPYRDSKLTRLLQDSLGGNTKTLMVAAISPADYNYEETLSTLRYANRAKNIKNKPKINEDPKDAILRQYKEEIETLKQQLAQASLAGISSASSTNINHDATAVVAPYSPPATASHTEGDTGSSNNTTVTSVKRQPSSARTGAIAATAAAVSDGTVKGSIPGGQETTGGDIDPSKTVMLATEGHLSIDVGPDEEGDALRVVGGDESRLGDVKEGGGAGGRKNLATPDVVIQEKIVERVVVEEKVIVQQVEVEVESQKMAEQRLALENYSKAVEEQRNRLGQELESSVFRADVERQAREEMARKLDALQTKVIGLSSSSEDRRHSRRSSSLAAGGMGGRGGLSMGTGDLNKDDRGGQFSRNSPETEDPEVIIARRNAEHRRMQAKLREKRRKETRLELERVRALEEKAEVEKEMADKVGQAEETERRLNRSRKKLEKKLVEAREEIEDLAMEHEREREELLDSIRNQNKEIQLWEQVTRQILPSKEIARIWERGEYDEDEQTWVLPRIKPRAGYASDSCKLPLLPAPGSANGTVDDNDAGGQASRGGGAGTVRKDRRRGGGGGDGGGGGGRRASVSKTGKVSGDGGVDGGESGGRRRRSVAGDRPNEDRPPRRTGEDVAPKEGGGGMFNDAENSREAFPSTDSGEPRNRGSSRGAGGNAVLAAGNLWEDASAPADDRYKGLTPPISPAQGCLSSPGQSPSGQGLFGQVQRQSISRSHRRRTSVEEPSETTRRPASRRESGLSAAGAWGFSGDVDDDGGKGRGGERRSPSPDGSSRADRCPSRQGGARHGSRATSGSRLGRDQHRHQEAITPSSSGPGDEGRSSTVPEDSLLRQNADDSAFGRSKDPAVLPARNSGGHTTNEKARAKSGRRKSRASIVSGREEDAAIGMMELVPNTGWGGGGGVQEQPGGTKQYRRPKSKTRVRDGGDGDGGDGTGYPSLLDSRMWDGGGGVGRAVGGADGARGGGSPGLERDIYDFRD